MATKVKAKPKTKALKTAKPKASNGALSKAERAALTADCIAPKQPTCPAVSGKDSPYMYQQGCRGGACKLANRSYYKTWRDKKEAEEARKRAKRAAARKKLSTAKKTKTSGKKPAAKTAKRKTTRR